MKGVKELLIDGQLRINIIELGSEVLVSADVPAMRWCYETSGELSIDGVKIVYASLKVPGIGVVEVAGCKVIDSLRAINIKYKVECTDAAVDTYRKIVEYMDKFCSES